MKQTVNKKDEHLVSYTIKDLVDGWLFRIREVSNGVYEVDGIDVWGRKVSCKGMESELDEVRQIQSSLNKE